MRTLVRYTQLECTKVGIVERRSAYLQLPISLTATHHP